MTERCESRETGGVQIEIGSGESIYFMAALFLPQYLLPMLLEKLQNDYVEMVRIVRFIILPASFHLRNCKFAIIHVLRHSV